MPLIDRVTTEELPGAVGAIFRVVIPALPKAVRDLPIGSVPWSQPFASNAWWMSLWASLRVVRVSDLESVGAALAETRGVGKAKLQTIIRDLVHLAEPDRDDPERAAALRAGTLAVTPSLEVIQAQMSSIAQSSTTPPPHLVEALLQAVVGILPAPLRRQRLDELPWSGEWCFTTSVWDDLKLQTVADLATAGSALIAARGIGKTKVLAIARDLLSFSPELDARMTGQTAEKGTRLPIASIVHAIDRLAGRLSERERDILRRRLGWRSDRPLETLREIAQDHGVTQERVRQIEQRLRKRLILLIRFRRLATLLRQAARSRGWPSPVDLKRLEAGGPAELAGLSEVWQPLAMLLAEEGGPYLYEDRRRHKVVVAPRPGPSHRKSDAPAERHPRWKEPNSCPTPPTPSVC